MGVSLGQPEWTRIEGRHYTPNESRRRRLDRTVIIEGGGLVHSESRAGRNENTMSEKAKPARNSRSPRTVR